MQDRGQACCWTRWPVFLVASSALSAVLLAASAAFFLTLCAASFLTRSMASFFALSAAHRRRSGGQRCCQASWAPCSKKEPFFSLS
jgi:hypothetical protein